VLRSPPHPQHRVSRTPPPRTEYVIVHELVHLLVPNHGKVFKSFLLAYLPDWQSRDAELRRLAAGPSPSPAVGDKDRFEDGR
jgi:Protein of unknown function DUF45